jgi:hypothetical protein
MKNYINEYGENAGKIWHALNDQGPLSQTKLIRTTKLDEDELHIAIGWLARENKIYIDGSQNNYTYRLGETNLTSKIGTDAGKIWKILHTYGENDIQKLSKFTRLEKKDVKAALGWLARENKIQIKQKDREIKYCLNNNQQ